MQRYVKNSSAVDGWMDEWTRLINDWEGDAPNYVRVVGTPEEAKR